MEYKTEDVSILANLEPRRFNPDLRRAKAAQSCCDCS